LATFYENEVIRPGDALIRSILQRGIARGEFHTIDLKYGVYTVLAPMLFLAMWKHSFGPNSFGPDRIVPEEYLAVQIDTILNGLGVRPPPTITAK
jgi:TetR/AcrR family transcriptional regulator